MFALMNGVSRVSLRVLLEVDRGADPERQRDDGDDDHQEERSDSPWRIAGRRRMGRQWRW